MHWNEKSLPGTETRLVLGDEDDGWRQPGWSWSHCWAAATANTCSRWLRGCKSVMAARAEDDSHVVAGAGRLGCWEALMKITGEGKGKGECKRKRASVAAARSLFVFTHAGISQQRRVPSPGARALCFSWFLTEWKSFLLVVRRSLFAHFCWYLLLSASSHFSWSSSSHLCVFFFLVFTIVWEVEDERRRGRFSCLGTEKGKELRTQCCPIN
jgi:hypothetical protein